MLFSYTLSVSQNALATNYHSIQVVFLHHQINELFHLRGKCSKLSFTTPKPLKTKHLVYRMKMYQGICKPFKLNWSFLDFNAIPKINCIRHFIICHYRIYTCANCNLCLHLLWTSVKRSYAGHHVWHQLFRDLVFRYGLSTQAAEFCLGLETLGWFPHTAHPH